MGLVRAYKELFYARNLQSEYIQIDFVKIFCAFQLECCGADSPTDWEGVLLDNDAYQLQEGDVIVPNSCCGNWTLESTDCAQPFTEGCLPALVGIAQAGAILLTGAAITVALIQVDL